MILVRMRPWHRNHQRRLLLSEDSRTINGMDLSLDSLAVHAGRADLDALGVHALPLDLSTTNPLPNVDSGGASYEAMATGGHPGAGGAVYQRLWNPTVARFEQALAALEHTTEAVAFSTGMAAVTAAVLAAKSERGGRRI